MTTADQLSITFPRARRTDPVTAHAAAARVDGQRLAAIVEADLREHGPATSHDLAARLGLSLVTVSPRLRPLARAGRVREAGRRDGRIVWEVVS